MLDSIFAVVDQESYKRTKFANVTNLACKHHFGGQPEKKAKCFLAPPLFYSAAEKKQK